jgi:hypothetical protein
MRDVVSRQRYGCMIVRKLKLKHHTFLHTKKIFTTDKIKLPHANEPVVIFAADRINVIAESEAPVAQGFGIMVTHDFDINNLQTLF